MEKLTKQKSWFSEPRTLSRFYRQHDLRLWFSTVQLFYMYDTILKHIVCQQISTCSLFQPASGWCTYYSTNVEFWDYFRFSKWPPLRGYRPIGLGIAIELAQVRCRCVRYVFSTMVLRICLVHIQLYWHSYKWCLSLRRLALNVACDVFRWCMSHFIILFANNRYGYTMHGPLCPPLFSTEGCLFLLGLL